MCTHTVYKIQWIYTHAVYCVHTLCMLKFWRFSNKILTVFEQNSDGLTNFNGFSTKFLTVFEQNFDVLHTSVFQGDSSIHQSRQLRGRLHTESSEWWNPFQWSDESPESPCNEYEAYLGAYLGLGRGYVRKVTDFNTAFLIKQISNPWTDQPAQSP